MSRLNADDLHVDSFATETEAFSTLTATNVRTLDTCALCSEYNTCACGTITICPVVGTAL
ncbi:MAG: hypothetical protein JWM27_4195 [Gemmatimonadetes bacterium]|nr:hypothetical protein [Gemmatimonadota bacterium]